MSFENILILLLVLIPYTYLGEEASAVFLTLVGIIYLLIKKVNIKIEDNYLLLLALNIILGLSFIFFSKDYFTSLNSLFLLVLPLIFYIIFLNNIENKDHILKCLLYCIVISSLVFIIIQGSFYNKRIDGNLGYANTYALLLLIALFLNEIIETNFYNLFQLIIFTGIIYTSSRNTLVYLAIFIVLKIYYNRRSKDVFGFLLNFFLALCTYVLIAFIGSMMVFIMPLIFIISYFVLEKIKPEIKNITSILITGIGIAYIFLINTNFSQRLRNFKLSSGVLQERFLYYIDTTKYIIKHPLGAGIGTFPYKQYSFQTAFYDVKYIHNSLIQSAYEMGILGLILYISIFILGLLIIWKNKNNRKYFIPLYLIIYLHSLLDFDFSYAVIIAMLSLLVAFSKEKLPAKAKVKKAKANNDIKEKLQEKSITSYLVKPFCIFLIAVTAYSTLINTLSSTALLTKNAVSYDISIKLNSAASKLTFKTPYFYSQIAECYNLKYSHEKGNNLDYLKSCIQYLDKAYAINEEDPRIVGNLALTHKNLLNKEQSILYFKKFLSLEKYYPKMYSVYYKFLNDINSLPPKGSYDNEIKNLKKTYDSAYKSLNEKSKYMNDQITKELK